MTRTRLEGGPDYGQLRNLKVEKDGERLIRRAWDFPGPAPAVRMLIRVAKMVRV
jgi:hypothetical protein